MDFVGKGYGSRREFNLVINGNKTSINEETPSQNTHMQIACDTIFTHVDNLKYSKF